MQFKSPDAGGTSHITPNDSGYTLVHKKILDLTGIDLNSYKQPQMLRRLDAILMRCQLPNLAALAAELKAGSPILQEFMERFTINVSECFRDKPRFEQLAQDIIPNMLKRNPALKIWSAGCSYGAEPYSLAMILHSLNATRATITATDIDPKILQAARAGENFTANDFKNLPKDFVAKYFTEIKGTTNFKVNNALKSFITFKQHNLLTPPPGENFDLVLCRNVTIYFTEEAKDQVTTYLVKALHHGGILFIGETETIHRPVRFNLNLRSTSFYERAA